MTRHSPAALVALAAILAACGGETVPAARAADVQKVPSVAAETLTVTAPLSLAAQLYVEHDAVIAARASGMLEQLAVDLGTRVTAGQIVGRVESAGQEIALAQATVAFENAERVVQRSRGMLKANAMTAIEVEQDELRFRQAELALRTARRELELTRVVAPFEGVVTARYARAPRLVAAGDTLIRITAMAPLLARVRVPEGSAGSVRAGDAVTVTTMDGQSTSARIERMAPAFDAGSGTREIVVRVGSGARMLPGASVQVRLGGQPRRVIAVPREAVGPDGYVLIVDGDRTTLRAVTVGENLPGGRVEVVSGLAAGERIARSGR